MNLKNLPPHVRAHLYVAWFGMALAGLGLLGFILSFGAVATPAQAVVDVHRDVPWGAWISIFAWAIGIGLTWYGRRQLNAAVSKRTQELADAALVELD